MTFTRKSRSHILSLALAIILTGCASTAPKGEQKEAAKSAPSAAQLSHSEKVYETRMRELVKQNPMFAILAAELANQRGDTETAVLAYVEASKELKRADLAKRGVEISLSGNNIALSLKAAQTWLELAPKDPQAERSVMLLQLSAGEVDAAMPALKQYLAQIESTEAKHPGLSHVSPEQVALQLLFRIPDHEQAYQAGLKLFGDNANDLKNQDTLSQLAYGTGHYKEAVEHIERVIAKKPTQRNYILLAQYLEKRDGNPKAAVALMKAQSDLHPKWFNTRLFLARAYAQASNWPLAKQRFDELIALQPKNYGLYSSQGFVLAKMHDRQGAEKFFKIYLSKTPEDSIQNETLIYLTLSGLAMDEKDYRGAIGWINAAPDAKDDIDLQLRKSMIYENQGKLRSAMKTLDGFKAQSEEDAVRVTLAKSQLAEKAKQPKRAESIIDSALDAYPDQADLLYERAMVSERQNDVNAVEKYLRRLIAVKPNSPNGYNALGYTFAERNIHLDEALKLIKKADTLSPHDPYIMDSLGWVYYRLGENAKAETALKEAFKLKNDEEIGTHLIQVLLKQGKNQEALALSDKLNALFPNSAQLKPWIKRARESSL